MKKIFVIILASAAFLKVSAQDYDHNYNDHRSRITVQFGGNPYGHYSQEHYDGRNGHEYGNSNNYYHENDDHQLMHQKIDEINHEYDHQISHVLNDSENSPWEQRRIVHELNDERLHRIGHIKYEYENHDHNY